MRHNIEQTGTTAGKVPGAKRGFWARFWESLRDSLGSVCF
jgi:hypothetical protein